ncbi:ABC transporter ATP-binding protein [Sedimenticola selenatireducens]|uniref:ABC transporter ATP-binding protein n=1 Tax=Sedimenticola selenatireducens TaxID=191960 RepID=A0A2N6CVG3_9GAMM|nr:ABC transporter ATP-binding protein [Sedimenticola selenatireducens]PLX61173.1 MAG: ABC transporter ATP-binding protein [Sedimenticola selenatireducens]
MSSILQVDNLVKHFNGVQAVNGVSFSIERGSCFGLLGPNGAGKTTTVEMLEGIITPTRGDVRYKGEPTGVAFRQEAGIMFQETSLQEFIRVGETLELFSRFYPRTRPIDELIERCALGEFLDRDVRRLSGGQRQRLLLAIALINDPQIVFLDEPTTGLDPQARRNFWQLVNDIKQEQKTLVLTTHYMEEAYELCDEIAIMDHGKIIAQGSPRALLKKHFDHSVICLPANEVPESLDQDAQLKLHRINGQVEILSEDINASIQQLIAQKVPLTHLQIRSRTLEDLFLELTGRELRS